MDCKYYKKIKQVSYDGGQTWYNTDETMRGDLYESGSTDCGYVPPVYRWVDTGTYMCNGTTKYKKMKKQVSNDNCVTWEDVSPAEYQAGSVIEYNSEDCGYTAETIYRWFTTSTYCDGIDLYANQKRQYSTDGGINWYDVVPEQTQQVLVAEHSRECGAAEYKVISYDNNGDAYYSYCAYGTTITSGDVKGDFADISNVTYAVIGTCATEIWTNAFRASSIDYIEIPSNITELHNSTFAYTELTEVHFKSSTPPVIGTNTFTGCQSLEAIYVPCGSADAYKAVSNLSQWVSLIQEESVCSCVPSYEKLDGASAYTASTASQELSIGTFYMQTCNLAYWFEAWPTNGTSEFGTPLRADIFDVEYGEDENEYIMEVGVMLPTSSTSSLYNIHWKMADRSAPNIMLYDFIITTVRITRA